MVIGIATPDAVLEMFQCIPGVHTITNYFTSTERQPQYKLNEAWNNPINDDAQVCSTYTTKTHMVTHGMMCFWVKTCRPWQILMLDVSAYQKWTWTGDATMCTMISYCDNAEHGHMQKHHSPPLIWSHPPITLPEVPLCQQLAPGAQEYSRLNRIHQEWVVEWNNTYQKEEHQDINNHWVQVCPK